MCPSSVWPGFGVVVFILSHTSLQRPLTTTLVKIMVWSWRILNKVLKEAAGFTDIEAQNGVQSSDDSSLIFLMHSFNAYSLFQQCSKLFPGFLSDYNIFIYRYVNYIYIGHIFIIYTLESINKHISLQMLERKMKGEYVNPVWWLMLVKATYSDLQKPGFSIKNQFI